MVSGQRVLVVDGLAETEEVLRAVLEPRGCQVESVRGRHTSRTVTDSGKTVLVLHEDHRAPRQAVSNDAAPGESTDWNASEEWEAAPRVVIGKASWPRRRLLSEAGLSGAAGAGGTGNRYLSQPFQYGELVQAIEELLATDPAAG